MIAEDTTVVRFPTKAWEIVNVQKHEEKKMKIQASDLELPLCLQILYDAILYFKEENKRCSEIDTQPVLKDFISGYGPLLKREEKKLQKMITSQTEDSQTRSSFGVGDKNYAILNPKTSLWGSSFRHNLWNQF